MAALPVSTDVPENRRGPGQFAPGVSGNPGGRPKGLASLVRERTLEGAALVDFHLAIMQGQAIDQPGGRRKLRPSLQQRMQAADWLADRGFGKVPQALEHSGLDGGPLQQHTLIEVRYVNDWRRLSADDDPSSLEPLGEAP